MLLRHKTDIGQRETRGKSTSNWGTGELNLGGNDGNQKWRETHTREKASEKSEFQNETGNDERKKTGGFFYKR